MEKIKIAITGRVASVVALPEVVADNAEYEVDFALDPREGWDMSLPITVLFVRRDGFYTPRIMDAGKTSCTMPPQTGTNIVFVGMTQDDMRTTTPAAIKVHRSIRTVAHDPLPAPSEDVYAQILAAYAGIKILSGKGAPTSETQGEVNQLYRDEDTQKLYICTATDGGYTWTAVSGGSVDVDATLTKAGYAADAKAAGDAIGGKIDAPQTAAVGEVLTVEEVDAEGKPKKWKTAPAAAEQVQSDWNQNDETAADYVKNRTHYSEYGEFMLHGWSGYYESVNKKFSVPIPIVVIQGNRFEDVPCTNNSGVVTYRPGNYSITANFIYSTLAVVERTNYTTISEEDVVFPVYQTVYHKIPENYIPDTIARANQIVKPDWNVVVESAPDAILNKPVIGLQLIKGETSDSDPVTILPSFNIPSRISGAILEIQGLTIVDYEDGDYIYFTGLSNSISGDLIQGNNLIIRMYIDPNYNNALAIPIVSKFGNDFVTPLLGMGSPLNFDKKVAFMLRCKGNKTIKCRGYGFYAV